MMNIQILTNLAWLCFAIILALWLIVVQTTAAVELLHYEFPLTSLHSLFVNWRDHLLCSFSEPLISYLEKDVEEVNRYQIKS